MWTDKSLYLCTNTNFYGSATSTYLGDVVDFAAMEPLLGAGKPVALVGQITTAATAGTAFTFGLDTGSSLTGGNLSGTIGTLLEIGVITTAQAVRGAKFGVYLPYLSWHTYRRYMQMKVRRTGTSTAGKITAFLTLDPPVWVARTAAPVPLV